MELRIEVSVGPEETNSSDSIYVDRVIKLVYPDEAKTSAAASAVLVEKVAQAAKAEAEKFAGCTLEEMNK